MSDFEGMTWFDRGDKWWQKLLKILFYVALVGGFFFLCHIPRPSNLGG